MNSRYINAHDLDQWIQREDVDHDMDRHVIDDHPGSIVHCFREDTNHDHHDDVDHLEPSGLEEYMLKYRGYGLSDPPWPGDKDLANTPPKYRHDHL